MIIVHIFHTLVFFHSGHLVKNRLVFIVHIFLFSSQLVKRSAKEQSRYPLMEEYDFKNDNLNPILNMDLRPSTRIRVSTAV